MCLRLRRSHVYDPHMSYKFSLGRAFPKEWHTAIPIHNAIGRLQKSVISSTSIAATIPTHQRRVSKQPDCACQRASLNPQCKRALYLDKKSPDYREQSKPVAGKKLQAKDLRAIMLMRSPVLGGENTGLLNFESAKDLA
jgi:hypothetical protein